MQESSSFWSDIKDLSEQLVKSPDSYCFARLADVYLKVGLLDDALQVARLGVSKYPRYISGQRAFALACQAKGLTNDAISALKLVTEAMPEDIASQKHLARLFVESGNLDAACNAFRTALEFAPDDLECTLELESLVRSSTLQDSSEETDDEIIEDLEILEELEIIEDDEPECDEESEISYDLQVAQPEAISVATSNHDPLSTSTLAELYVSQGFIHKALDIYRTILADNPADLVSASRLSELESINLEPVSTVIETDETLITASEEIEEDLPSPIFTDTSSFQKNESESLQQFDSLSNAASNEITIAPIFQQGSPVLLQKTGIADNALATLDMWLDNIRRIKSCR